MTDETKTALLSKLRAPVADERDRNDTISQIVGLCNRIPGATTWNAAQFMYDEMHRRAALASAPVAGEAHTPIGFVDPVYVAGRQRGMKWNAKIYDAPNQEATAPLYAAPQASEADGLIDALGQCRDAFPIPDKVGSKLDLLWQEAMSDPTAVPEYVKLCAALSAQPGAQKEQSDAG